MKFHFLLHTITHHPTDNNNVFNKENSYVFLSMNMGVFGIRVYFLSFTYRIPMQCVDTESDVMAVALARNHQLFVNNANVARPFRTLSQIHTHTYNNTQAQHAHRYKMLSMGLPAFAASAADCRSAHFH